MECKNCKTEFAPDSAGHPALYASQCAGFCSVDCDRKHEDNNHGNQEFKEYSYWHNHEPE